MGSPLYGTFLERCAEGRDDTTVLRLLGARPSNEDLIHGGSVLKLLAAVHELALRGDAPSLAMHYPSCGGDDDVEAAWRAFVRTVQGTTTEIGLAMDRPLQTNEIGRAAPLLGGFLWVVERFGLPLRIMEVGASAGLLLRWDRFRYEAPEWTWGPRDASVRIDRHFSATPPPFSPDVRVRIIERVGCDVAPIDPTTTEGTLKLRSFVWPDQRERLNNLRAACEIASAVPASVERASAPSWLQARLQSPVGGAATVVYHTVMRQYLKPEERAALYDTLLAAAGRATHDAPLAYLTLEPEPNREANVLLHVWPGDMEIEIASASLHGLDVHWRTHAPYRKNRGTAAEQHC
ncbi:MAG: DUF2332 domain-containing protein [Candidatus Eremiobacteraeota bacterium]|nr:DUF2332 domain-containing protein [Candidatus Eremiobacteraeota bacterium]